MDTAGAAELGYLIGADAASDAMLVRAALTETPPPADWRDEIARGAAAEFPLRAADLMPRYQGPALGEALRRAEEAWIDSGFALSAEELRNLPPAGE